MNFRGLPLILGLLIVIGIGSGQVRSQAGDCDFEGDLKKKIAFDLGQFNDDGLYGPPGGLRALDYEFCIPADPNFEAQVKAIDPTLTIFPGSKGRVGCDKDAYLCIGNTHQREFKAVLLKLAGLSYVTQIKQCFWE
jgi:hypothetical protein